MLRFAVEQLCELQHTHTMEIMTSQDAPPEATQSWLVHFFISSTRSSILLHFLSEVRFSWTILQKFGSILRLKFAQNSNLAKVGFAGDGSCEICLVGELESLRVWDLSWVRGNRLEHDSLLTYLHTSFNWLTLAPSGPFFFLAKPSQAKPSQANCNTGSARISLNEEDDQGWEWQQDEQRSELVFGSLSKSCVIE